MISNEDRREVANWLRLSGESLGFDNCFVQMLCDVEGTNLPPEDFDAAGYLADLIDRPTCQRTECDHRYWRCSRCGAFVRWVTATNLTGVVPTRYCPNCGAEVESE